MISHTIISTVPLTSYNHKSKKHQENLHPFPNGLPFLHLDHSLFFCAFIRLSTTFPFFQFLFKRTEIIEETFYIKSNRGPEGEMVGVGKLL